MSCVGSAVARIQRVYMTTEQSLTDSALRAWKQNIDRATKLFAGFSEEQLLHEVAPGKNRLIYLWGHLTAVNDALIPLLGFGERLHPELDAMFLSNPDRFLAQTLSGKELRQIWDEINDSLWTAFCALSASEWVRKHASVPEDDFAREPHRNRFAVLLSRTEHIAYHLGQATLAKQSASA
jgi:hypothetical protein